MVSVASVFTSTVLATAAIPAPITGELPVAGMITSLTCVGTLAGSQLQGVFQSVSIRPVHVRGSCGGNGYADIVAFPGNGKGEGFSFESSFAMLTTAVFIPVEPGSNVIPNWVTSPAAKVDAGWLVTVKSDEPLRLTQRAYRSGQVAGHLYFQW